MLNHRQVNYYVPQVSHHELMYYELSELQSCIYLVNIVKNYVCFVPSSSWKQINHLKQPRHIGSSVCFIFSSFLLPLANSFSLNIWLTGKFSIKIWLALQMVICSLAFSPESEQLHSNAPWCNIQERFGAGGIHPEDST